MIKKINMSKETIKFLKIRDVYSPCRANPDDAGIDFFVPEFDGKFIADLFEKNKSLADGRLAIHDNGFDIPAHERALIPSGIKSRMAASGRALIAANKSGVATKKGLIFGAQVVDYTYKGEIHISVINTTDQPVRIEAGMKLIQFLEMPVYSNPVEITDNSELKNPQIEKDFYDGLGDDRGEGGFGSTGS